MGYLLLSIALITGALKGYCGKRLGSYTDGMEDSMRLNFWRMVLCSVFGFAVILISGNLCYLKPDFQFILISLISAAGTVVFVVTWLLAVRENAYMMLDVFLTIGTLVPILGEYLFFGNEIGIRRFLGFMILIAATLIMCSYNRELKGKFKLTSLILLLISGFANGLADFSQKFYVRTYPSWPISVFNFYTYIFAAIILAIFVIIFKAKRSLPKATNHKIRYGYVSVMALALTANTYFKTAAAVHLDSMQLYPLNQSAAMILSLLMSVLLFKEKFTLKVFFGMLLAFAGLMVINL